MTWVHRKALLRQSVKHSGTHDQVCNQQCVCWWLSTAWRGSAFEVLITYVTRVLCGYLHGVITWKLFPRYWPFCGEFAGDRWISLTRGPVMWTVTFFYEGPHRLFNKQWNDRWFETIWRSCDVIVLSKRHYVTMATCSTERHFLIFTWSVIQREVPKCRNILV